MSTYQYEVPPIVVPENDAGYFEKITQAVFQAGFSWQVIRNKWPNFVQAFHGFDIDTVAAFDELDIERLVQDKGIVRNGRKITATVKNAQICQTVVKEHGTFHNYLRSMDQLTFAQKEKAFCKKFKFMGPMGAFFFFHSVGETVPDYHEWRASKEK
jgi:DNA-3-methyladenine glycosylase I